MDETFNPALLEADSQRHDKWVSILSWLLPLTYVIHIAEEYWVGEGYLAYLYRIRGVHMSPTRFWVAQMIGTALMVAGVVIAKQKFFLRTMLVVIGSIIFVNGITHTATAIITYGYGPGLYSSIFLWIPLGLATLIHFRKRVIRWKYWICIGIGVAINLVVDIFTLRGGRIL